MCAYPLQLGSTHLGLFSMTSSYRLFSEGPPQLLAKLLLLAKLWVALHQIFSQNTQSLFSYHRVRGSSGLASSGTTVPQPRPPLVPSHLHSWFSKDFLFYCCTTWAFSALGPTLRNPAHGPILSDSISHYWSFPLESTFSPEDTKLQWVDSIVGGRDASGRRNV